LAITDCHAGVLQTANSNQQSEMALGILQAANAASNAGTSEPARNAPELVVNVPARRGVKEQGK
jgi:hypothetical protein